MHAQLAQRRQDPVGLQPRERVGLQHGSQLGERVARRDEDARIV
jgi:hypothetical protein